MAIYNMLECVKENDILYGCVAEHDDNPLEWGACSSIHNLDIHINPHRESLNIFYPLAFNEPHHGWTPPRTMFGGVGWIRMTFVFCPWCCPRFPILLGVSKCAGFFKKKRPCSLVRGTATDRPPYPLNSMLLQRFASKSFPTTKQKKIRCRHTLVTNIDAMWCDKI